MEKRSYWSGHLMIEALLTIGLTAVLLPILIISLMASRDGRVRQVNQAEATALLKDTEEAVKGVKKSGWLNLPGNGTYYPAVSGGNWVLMPGASTSGRLTKSVVISEVRRATTSGQIVSSGGYVDPSTKKFDITISWTHPNSSSINSTFFLTRNENLSRNGDLTDFLSGTHVQTQATSSAGGKVILEYNTKGKWCSPAFTNSTVDLPDGPPVAVAASAAANVSIPNDIYVATAPNTSSVIKLAYVNTTANTSTPAASLRGKFTLDPGQYSSGTYPTVLGNPPAIANLDNSFKTNDVTYYKSTSGKLYALLATDLPDKEIVVVQINDGTGDAYQDGVNKIYKYHTFFNTRIYAGSPAVTTDTGFLNPSAEAADTGGDGNGFESSPTQGYTNDGNYAVDNNSGTGTSTNCTDSGKDRHRYYNYTVSLPTGANISGIEVLLQARVNSLSGSPDPKSCVELSWDGGATWTSSQSQTYTSTNEREYYFGGSSDTWGRTWSESELTNANFQIRITNVANDNTRDFRLDWAALKVYYYNYSYDQAPFGHGVTALRTLENTGYAASGGYLYVFDLSNIDSKSPTNGLDMKGCRILLNGFECQPAYGIDLKYSAGETGSSWSSTATPAHPSTCADGGNIELYSTNDIYPVKVGSNTYVYAAIGAGTNPEFEVADVTTIPSNITTSSCGRGTDTGWRVTDTIDFNDDSGTEEAANSVFGKSDGTRAYVSSNGGDAKQFYVINTTNKSDLRFLSGTSSPPTSGFYYGSSPNDELFVRSSLTVLNGSRAVIAGKDGFTNGDNAQEYQVLNLENETSPLYCGGLDFDDGFNDLTGVSEADGDNFVYMISNSGTNELKIIQGGPDGNYLDSGNYTSPPIDIGYSTIFNRYIASFATPSSTAMDFQFAAADPGVNGCDDANYVFTGPGGDINTKYATSSAAIWVGNSGGYKNPARCFKYRSFLSTTNFNNTPEISQMIINYAP
jgi:type II secretory pathway pseudopilin PulG